LDAWKRPRITILQPADCSIEGGTAWHARFQLLGVTDAEKLVAAAAAYMTGSSVLDRRKKLVCWKL